MISIIAECGGGNQRLRRGINRAGESSGVERGDHTIADLYPPRPARIEARGLVTKYGGGA